MKRVLYILGVVLVGLLLVSSMLVAVLMSDTVETAAVRLVTKEVSRTLGTTVQIGKVEYRFPARLALRDVYIEDLQGDTLLYAGEVYAHFRPLALKHDEIRFSHVRLTDGVGKIYRVPTAGSAQSDSLVWNYSFLADAFKSDKQSASEPLKSLIAVQDIRLDNIRLEYEDYTGLLSHAVMDLHELSEQAIDAEIRELAMQITNQTLKPSNSQTLKPSNLQTSPFIVEDMKAHVILNDTMLSVPTLRAQLPNSRLDMSGIQVRFPAGDTLYLSRSAHEILFALRFNEAQIVPTDLALFAPKVQGMKRPVVLRGALTGTLDSLTFKDLAVRYDGQTLLEGDVSAIGLPDIANPYLRANLTDLHTNAAQLQDILSQLNGRPVHLPQAIHRLGDIHYRGSAEGRLHDMTLHGAFRTALGAISTDGTIRSDSLFDHITYDARVVGNKFRLGRLIANDRLGTVTLDVASQGQIDEGVVRGDVNAHVRHLTYNNYTYSDLHLKGRYDPQRYKGDCSIADPHLNASFSGVVDLREKDPEINFNLRCRHFDSAPLTTNPLTTNPLIRTSFAMAVDMNGAKADEISGYMVIDSLFVATARDSILMNQLTLLAIADEKGQKDITLQTDYISAQVNGVFRYADIIPSLQALMHHYLPSAVAAPTRAWNPVTMRMSADGVRLRDVQRLFTAPVTVSDHTTLRAETSIADGQEPFVSLRLFAPGIRAANTPVHDLTVMLNTVDTLRHPGASGSGLSLSLSAEAMQMHTVLSTLAFHDTLLTHLTLRQEAQMNELLPEGWETLSPRELQHALNQNESLTGRDKVRAMVAAQRAGDYGGDLQCITHFSQYNKRPLIDMHFLPGMMLLRDSVYTLGESRITWCSADTSLLVERFSFEGGGQHIRANGLASRRASDTLAVDLQKIDASYVVPFVLPVQTIMFQGLLTGKANITSTFLKPQIDTQIHIDSMGLNNCLFGDAEVDLHIKDSLAFHADVYKLSNSQTLKPSNLQTLKPSKRTVVDLRGKALFDGSGVWELDMQTDSVPLRFINHWTQSVLTDLQGNGTGRVVVGGSKKREVYVLLRCAALNSSFTLPWTGARYTIPHDTIVMDTTAILFPNVHLTDTEGNKVEVNGGVYHDQFKDFTLDIHVDAHHALVFDNNTKGESIQGHVYADGHVDVTGPEDDIIVSADAVTTKNSSFRLSLDNASSANESNFIHFMEHPSLARADADTIKESDLDNIDIVKESKVDSTLFKRAGRCIVKLNIEVNPMLLFQLVLGERNGDIIQGRGTGALSLTYDTETGDVRLLGTYDLEHGTLSYTVANMIRKEFTVGEGSTIVFSGDPSNPQLDVTAKYKVTANLRDLFGSDADKVGTTRSNIPVLTCLHMTGPLNNPILSFALEFPLSDQNIQQQVRQVINTDEMLMRQVIYLLVFGRFFTPDYMANAQYATLNSTYSLLSSTVTSQINSWLSKLTNILTLGVAIRTDGEGDNSSQEYEAQFQLQPVDRLIINGNVGYRYNDVSNQPFFGDLDVEVLLTEDGQWRLKGYTHTVDKYSLRQASTIQGVGFMWKKDF
jgi:hypothetical protein